MEEDIKAKHIEITKHRADDLLKQIESAGFSDTEIIELKKMVADYHILETKLSDLRLEQKIAANKRKEINMEDTGDDHESGDRKYEEKRLKDKVRFKRRDIESRIRDRLSGQDL